MGSGEALDKIKVDGQFEITNASEKELALAILRLPEQLDLAVTSLDLNRVCDLLYEIATKIASFYNESMVVGSEQEASRVLLLEATRKVMGVCFDLLGMKTIDKI